MLQRSMCTAIGTIAGAALVIAASCWAAAAEVPPAGTSVRTVVAGGAPITVHLFAPACPIRSLLVIFHGLGRNVEGYRDYARPIAERDCRLVAAPLLDRERFPLWRYQHGGLARESRVLGRAEWTGPLVLALIEALRQYDGRRLPYALLGHSAGAQHVLRLAASVATEAERIVAANPGTLVWAETAVAAPYGLGGLGNPADDTARLASFLAAPITIYLGVDDTRDADLSRQPEALRQGPTRHARGLAIFRAAEAKARAAKLPFGWRLVELPGVGHDARAMLAAPAAGVALAP